MPAPAIPAKVPVPETGIPDPYLITQDKIRDAPTSLWGIVGYLGPGFVMPAAIVGSGELIATTPLGRWAGGAFPITQAPNG